MYHVGRNAYGSKTNERIKRRIENPKGLRSWDSFPYFFYDSRHNNSFFHESMFFVHAMMSHLCRPALGSRREILHDVNIYSARERKMGGQNKGSKILRVLVCSREFSQSSSSTIVIMVVMILFPPKKYLPIYACMYALRVYHDDTLTCAIPSSVPVGKSWVFFFLFGLFNL